MDNGKKESKRKKDIRKNSLSMETPKGSRQNENGRNSRAFGDSKSRRTRMDLPLRRLGGFHRLCRLEGWGIVFSGGGSFRRGERLPAMWGTIRAGQKGHFPMSALRGGGVSQKIRVSMTSYKRYRHGLIGGNGERLISGLVLGAAASSRLLPKDSCTPLPSHTLIAHLDFWNSLQIRPAALKTLPPHSESFSLKMV
jgi:hypothetical protein